MNVLVMALDTHECIEKEQAWLAPNHRYYTSEAAYLQIQKQKAEAQAEKEKRLKTKALKHRLNDEEKEYYKQITDKMADWLDYQQGKIIPAMFFKKVKQWKDCNNYSYQIILETMNLIDDRVKWMIKTKNFKDSNSKVAYICAVISSYLNDGADSWHRKQKAINEARKQETLPTEEDINNFSVQKPAQSRSELTNAMVDIMGDLF